MTPRQFLIGGAAATALVVCVPTVAPAQTAEAIPVAMLTAEEAIAIALKAQTGTIGEAELDEFEGKPAYDIEVVTEVGEEIEFKIDAVSGEILNTWTDDDPSDDPAPGAAEEAGN